MTLSIKEGDLTVSVEIPNPDEQFDHAELLLMAALKAIGCCIGGGNAVRAYYHVDPDTLQLREDDEILWQLYQKYNLEAYKHIAEKWFSGVARYPFIQNFLLKDINKKYNLKIEHFSNHSLRKTFGRKIFELASSQGQGELALIKLSELFNHSNASITRIYLGIKEEEMLSTYDMLEF